MGSKFDQGKRLPWVVTFGQGHENIKPLEYWQSQEGPRRALCKFAEAMLEFLKSRSKVTVKVTRKNVQNLWFRRKGLVIRYTHAKYESLISLIKKVMANVKVFQK